MTCRCVVSGIATARRGDDVTGTALAGVAAGCLGAAGADDAGRGARVAGFCCWAWPPYSVADASVIAAMLRNLVIQLRSPVETTQTPARHRTVTRVPKIPRPANRRCCNLLLRGSTPEPIQPESAQVLDCQMVIADEE
jgi:hypothetical protein